MIGDSNYIKLGVLGGSLSHSLSPQVHGYILEDLGVLGIYNKYQVHKDEIPNILPMMIEDNILGLNVTNPYKETLYHLVDELDEHGKAIRAINTIKVKNGAFYGYNTDYLGAIHMFRNANVNVKNRNIVIIGSGGSAKGLVYALKLECAGKITVVARNHQSSKELKEQFPFIETLDLEHFIRKTIKGDIIINTTPVGMFPNVKECPIPKDVFKYFTVAIDIVYNPLITRFLTLAKSQHLEIVTGLSMLICQAIGAQEIWLDRKIDYKLAKDIENKLRIE